MIEPVRDADPAVSVSDLSLMYRARRRKGVQRRRRAELRTGPGQRVRDARRERFGQVDHREILGRQGERGGREACAHSRERRRRASARHANAKVGAPRHDSAHRTRRGFSRKTPGRR